VFTPGKYLQRCVVVSRFRYVSRYPRFTAIGSSLESRNHTFFLAWGEVTITLEDIERILLLPCLGDNDLTAINLTVEETRWEDAFYLGFGGREASTGG
jgi:hypothetical protein